MVGLPFLALLVTLLCNGLFALGILFVWLVVLVVSIVLGKREELNDGKESKSKTAEEDEKEKGVSVSAMSCSKEP